VRLLTRNGIDWTGRFPLIAEAAGALTVRSFLIDGEAVACDRDGMPSFDRPRYRRQDGAVFLFAFDLARARRHGPSARADRDAQGNAGQPAARGPGGLHLNEHFERCSEVGRRRSGGRPRRIGGGSIDGEAERPQTGPRAREGLKSTLTRARAIRAAAPRAVPEESTS
jgi:hypothetical protein